MKLPAPLRFLFAPRPSAFCLRLAALLVLSVALSLSYPFVKLVEEPLLEVNAWLTHSILSLLGEGTRLSGRFVASTSSSFSIEVVSGCTGLFVFLTLVSAILAFPTHWRERTRGILMGAALIFLLNLVRITSLFAVGRRYPAYFEDLHLYVWQGIIIVIVAAYWYLWALRLPAEAALPAFRPRPGMAPGGLLLPSGRNEAPAPPLPAGASPAGPGPTRPRGFLRPAFFLRILAAFFVSLALWYLVRHPYTRLVARSGAEVLSVFSGIPAQQMLREEGGRFKLDTGLTGEKGDVTISLALYPVSWNLVILGALFLLLPARRLRRFWPWALGAVVLLWLSQVAFFGLATYAQVAEFHEAQGQPFQEHGLTRLLGLLVQGYGLTLSSALPFFLSAPLFLLPEKRREQSRRTNPGGAAPGRNAPCPCGSGRKHKRCCGA